MKDFPNNLYNLNLSPRERCTFLLKYKTNRPYKTQADAQFIDDEDTDLLMKFNREHFIQI